MSDQQSRLEQAYDFQGCYQDALQAASSWLDNVQLKLFAEDWTKDTDSQAAGHAVSTFCLLRSKVTLSQIKYEIECTICVSRSNEINRIQID